MGSAARCEKRRTGIPHKRKKKPGIFHSDLQGEKPTTLVIALTIIRLSAM